MTPLYIAAVTGNIEMCKILLDHKANINLVSTKYGYSPLDIISIPGPILPSDSQSVFDIPQRVS